MRHTRTIVIHLGAAHLEPDRERERGHPGATHRHINVILAYIHGHLEPDRERERGVVARALDVMVEAGRQHEHVAGPHRDELADRRKRRGRCRGRGRGRAAVRAAIATLLGGGGGGDEPVVNVEAVRATRATVTSQLLRSEILTCHVITNLVADGEAVDVL